MPFRGAVVQSEKVRQMRLRVIARPLAMSSGMVGYDNTIRPKPTLSAMPVRNTYWATLGSHSCK